MVVTALHILGNTFV